MDGLGDPLPYIIFLVAMVVIFWWTMIRPQRKRLAQQKELLDSLQRGDRVVTAGGLHGEIVGMQDKTLTLEIAPDVRIRIERRAVRRRYGDGDESE